MVPISMDKVTIFSPTPFFSPYPVTSEAMQWATCPLQANRMSETDNSLASTH